MTQINLFPKDEKIRKLTDHIDECCNSVEICLDQIPASAKFLKEFSDFSRLLLEQDSDKSDDAILRTVEVAIITADALGQVLWKIKDGLRSAINAREEIQRIEDGTDGADPDRWAERRDLDLPTAEVPITPIQPDVLPNVTDDAGTTFEQELNGIEEEFPAMPYSSENEENTEPGYTADPYDGVEKPEGSNVVNITERKPSRRKKTVNAEDSELV